MKRRAYLWVALLVAGMAVTGFYLLRPAAQMLVIENTKTSQILYQTACEEGMEFSISFFHSVNHSDVEEIYQLRDGKIYVTGCRYSAFGAGVATEVEEGQTLLFEPDGTMLLTGIDMEIDDLRYFFGTVYDHFLHINGEIINLSDIGGKNISARIYIK